MLDEHHVWMSHISISSAGIVEALVGAANDKDEGTQTALCKAIVDIGIKKHVVVIKICLNYLTKYTKVCIAVSPE